MNFEEDNFRDESTTNEIIGLWLSGWLVGLTHVIKRKLRGEKKKRQRLMKKKGKERKRERKKKLKERKK